MTKVEQYFFSVKDILGSIRQSNKKMVKCCTNINRNNIILGTEAEELKFTDEGNLI